MYIATKHLCYLGVFFLVCFLNSSFPLGSQNRIGKALIIAGKMREQTQQSQLL